MRRLFTSLRAFGATLLIGLLGLGAAGSGEYAKPSVPSRAAVVVELFTSEGCASCPPADALLAKLDELSRVGNAQVLALEEHVDYWDDQGWRDPFSSHNWTTRQGAYAGVLGNKNPYTPQIVVDGSTECSGGQPQLALQKVVQESSQAKTPVTLSQGAA